MINQSFLQIILLDQNYLGMIIFLKTIIQSKFYGKMLGIYFTDLIRVFDMVWIIAVLYSLAFFKMLIKTYISIYYRLGRS